MSLDIHQHRRDEAAVRGSDRDRMRRGNLDPESISLAAHLQELVHAPIRFDKVKVPRTLVDEDFDADDQ